MNGKDSIVGFAVLYRWRIRPDAEKAFADAWRRISELLEKRGSLGARLHKGEDGIWYSYAQWPTSKARVDAFALGDVDVDVEAQATMQAAILEYLPEVPLTPVVDLLR